MRGYRKASATGTKWPVRHEWESAAAIEESIEDVPHQPVRVEKEPKRNGPFGIRLARLEW